VLISTGKSSSPIFRKSIDLRVHINSLQITCARSVKILVLREPGSGGSDPQTPWVGQGGLIVGKGKLGRSWESRVGAIHELPLPWVSTIRPPAKVKAQSFSIPFSSKIPPFLKRCSTCGVFIRGFPPNKKTTRRGDHQCTALFAIPYPLFPDFRRKSIDFDIQSFSTSFSAICNGND
jgi:hypothetical protein